SANPITSLSSTFAANEGAGTTTVRSGSLTIPAGSLVGGPGPNPFYEFVFSTPFTYTGGSLLATFIHSDPGVSSGLNLDANFITPLGDVGNRVAFLGSDTSTTGRVGFYNAPVLAFDITTAVVPEPSTLWIAVSGLVPGLGYLRYRRPR